MWNQLNKYLCKLALAVVSKYAVKYANYQFITSLVAPVCSLRASKASFKASLSAGIIKGCLFA